MSTTPYRSTFKRVAEASEQAREAREREALVKEALRSTAPLRADLEGRMRMGLRTGDAEMMRDAIKARSC